MSRGPEARYVEVDGVPICLNVDMDYSQCLRELNHKGPCVFPPPSDEPDEEYVTYPPMTFAENMRIVNDFYETGRASGKSLFATLFES